jgi:hypothetical protein
MVFGHASEGDRERLVGEERIAALEQLGIRCQVFDCDGVDGTEGRSEGGHMEVVYWAGVEGLGVTAAETSIIGLCYLGRSSRHRIRVADYR